MSTDFDTALASFVAGCQRIVTENDRKYDNPDLFKTKIEVEPGRRYVRIVRSDKGLSRSAHCFVDTKNGDVLKAAGWKAPAKHARGNIFNADNGLDCMGPYGAAYIRG